MDSDSDDLIVIATFGDRIEAELARTALEAAGIDSIVRADDVAGLRPHMSLTNGVEILVRTADAATAREILAGTSRPRE